MSEVRVEPLSVLRWRDADEPARDRLLGRGVGQIFDLALRESIASIIDDVREHGDEAVACALERFDGCKVDPGALRVSAREFELARASMGPEVQDAVRDAIANIRAFNQAALTRARLADRATQMLLGPSESLVIADDSADVRLLAADLLNEAEHGPDSSSLLVTDSESLLDATQGELSRQLQALHEPRRSYAMSALGDNGGCVLVGDLSDAAEVANAYAPEHMQLVVREDYEEAMLGRLEHAGEILVGQHTPIAAANYTIGVPAALPTGGFARVTSGVTAETFLKRTSIASADAAALRSMAPAALALAAHEGFPAHAAAIRARLDEAG